MKQSKLGYMHHKQKNGLCFTCRRAMIKSWYSNLCHHCSFFLQNFDCLLFHELFRTTDMSTLNEDKLILMQHSQLWLIHYCDHFTIYTNSPFRINALLRPIHYQDWITIETKCTIETDALLRLIHFWVKIHYCDKNALLRQKLMHYWDKYTIATKMHYWDKMPYWDKIALLRSIHYFYKFFI